MIDAAKVIMESVRTHFGTDSVFYEKSGEVLKRADQKVAPCPVLSSFLHSCPTYFLTKIFVFYLNSCFLSLVISFFFSFHFSILYLTTLPPLLFTLASPPFHHPVHPFSSPYTFLSFYTVLG